MASGFGTGKLSCGNIYLHIADKLQLSSIRGSLFAVTAVIGIIYRFMIRQVSPFRTAVCGKEVTVARTLCCRDTLSGKRVEGRQKNCD